MYDYLVHAIGCQASRRALEYREMSMKARWALGLLGRVLAEQVKPLLIVGLLLTLPIICHGESALAFRDMRPGASPRHALQGVPAAHSHTHSAGVAASGAAPAPDVVGQRAS